MWWVDRPLVKSMSCTHRPVCSAEATVWCLCFEISKILGARFLGAAPSSQDEYQNFAVKPSPRVILVAAAKRLRSESSQGISIPTQGLNWHFHSCQSQRSLMAEENCERLRIPRPPRWVGRHTLPQLTLHFAPEITLFSAQRKRRLILSMA